MATTVIVGSGIIGIATAYYLCEHQPGWSIHVVDSSTELFASASGYAGGFIAKDWFPPELASLGALSFEEHERLAEKYDGHEKWAYAKSVTVNYEPPRRKANGPGGEDWLREGGSRVDLVAEKRDVEDGNSPPWLRRVKGDAVSVVDNAEGTAVLDPIRLCQFLLGRCRAAGVRFHHPAVVLNVGPDCHDELSHVRIGFTDCSSETEIPATRIYARPNGDIWLGGVNSAIPLPPLATAAKPMRGPLEKLKATARQLIKSEGELEVVRTGLCFRPVTQRGTPYVTRVEDVDLRQGYRTRKGADGGVFVAAGHGPWGISLSLGTGKVMAEMMQGRELSADISGLGYLP
ncbi:uncharacterized protein NECHADRAFT_40961 [Fusarium vanettenii 77-13-4]|uniref:FAD dependent oxidoreductase domain-containing protein n=1 Tax=Fusarium vanettenii (strain ATCC MYA-4622 / CBS 123669 / FGSC 9596 / NRRL 45880 / 77-13-4) TaxID=660122 RepID=C7YSG0_FUSV7|nr:uncharacterized protein NECHADRAFT_40961 [Fusarium vanettenii 77-13-4]EEU45242.1 hypothetical protein NECHADRAFT_40961 [Fusarium vanettenii 77-13-4]